MIASLLATAGLLPGSTALASTALPAQTTGGSGGCQIPPGGISVQGLCTAANSLHIPVAYRSTAAVSTAGHPAAAPAASAASRGAR